MAAQSEHLEQQAKSTAGTIIAADKVEGTNVYNRAGEKLGSVDHVMIDKANGNVCYAVMSFGGFLGIGESYHPLPWRTLTYDTDKGGFVVDLSKQQLEGAPYYDKRDHAWTTDYGRQIDTYYGLPPYI
jgi:hypothetical protein